MRSSLCRAFCAASLFLTTVAVSAQSARGELQLIVTAPSGQPLQASGALTSEAPQTSRTFRTNEEGRFSFDLAFGIYRLVVDEPGFVAYSDVVEIRSAVPKTVRVELAVAPVVTHVDVKAQAPLVDTERTGVSYGIGARQIADSVSTIPGRQVLDLVDQQPGWLMEANGVLHPRGSEYQTLFVVDGIPMDENRSPAFAPDLQDGAVTSVSVLTGNFPAEYGRKLGGVVEVTTTKDIDRGFHGLADFAAGSFATASTSAVTAYGWASRSLSIGVSAARTDRYLDPPVLENFTNRGSVGGVTLGYQDHPSVRDRFRASWRHRATSFLVPNEHIQEEAGQHQQREGSEDAAQAGWTRVVQSRFVVNTTASVRRLSATLESNPLSTPIIAGQDRAFTRGHVLGTLAIDAGRNQIKVGADAVFATVRERLDYRITDESFFEEGTPAVFAFADRKPNREQSVFAQDSIRLGPVTASAGLRWDRYALVVHDSAFSPRFGVAWAAPARNIVLRASFDRVFQTPAVENLLLASSPSTDRLNAIAIRLPVRPSRGNFIEGGVTAGLLGTARLDVTAYRRHVTDFADDDVFLNTGISFPIAFSAAVVRGIDAKLTVPAWRRFGGSVSYSLLKGVAELPVVGGLLIGEEALEAVARSNRVTITQDQRHTARAQGRFDAGGWWVTGAFRYGSGLPVELESDADIVDLTAQYGDAIIEHVEFDRGRVSANLAFDAGFGIEVWRRDRQRLVLRAEGTNLTNRLNVINFAGLFSGTAIGSPRAGTVRLQLEF